jgi:hypothetical protein
VDGFLRLMLISAIVSPLVAGVSNGPVAAASLEGLILFAWILDSIDTIRTMRSETRGTRHSVSMSKYGAALPWKHVTVWLAILMVYTFINFAIKATFANDATFLLVGAVSALLHIPMVFLLWAFSRDEFAYLGWSI